MDRRVALALVPIALTLCAALPFGGGGRGQFTPSGQLPPQSTVACTDGVDCLCDRTSSDGSRVACEDFDSPDLYSTTNMVDDSTQPGERGHASYWHQNFGTFANTSAMWLQGEPNATPKVGSQCNVQSGSACNGPKEWCPPQQSAQVPGGGADDCWEANGIYYEIDIFESADDFPTVNVSNPGAFEGRSFGHVIHPGNASGIKGSINWSGNCSNGCSQIGISMALAYVNVAGSDLADEPWKHDEDGGSQRAGTTGNNTISHWTHGISSGCQADNPLNSHFPYCPFMDVSDAVAEGGDQSCSTSASNATVRLADSVSCDTRLRYQADSSVYDWSEDWGEGVWGCSQAWVDLSTGDFRIWHNNELIIDFTYPDPSHLTVDSITHRTWNSYANSSQVPDSSTEMVYRAQDSFYVREDALPLHCNDLDDPNGGRFDFSPVCGNYFVESGETCDDGNTTPGDGCNATCTGA